MLTTFATCNEINRLSKPLQSRFRRLHLPPYAKEQFVDIAVKVCPKLKEKTSRIIGEEVWKQGSKDIRDIISLGKLIRKGDGPYEIDPKNGEISVDRILFPAIFYPCNYGFIPQTKEEDGEDGAADPIDVFILGNSSFLPNSEHNWRQVHMATSV